MMYHKYSLFDIENMVPWEREVYVKLIIDWIQQKKDESKK